MHVRFARCETKYDFNEALCVCVYLEGKELGVSERQHRWECAFARVCACDSTRVFSVRVFLCVSKKPRVIATQSLNNAHSVLP